MNMNAIKAYAEKLVNKVLPYSGDNKAVTFVISIVTGLVAVVISTVW